MTLQAVQPGDDGKEAQLTFDGMPVQEAAFKLTGVTKMYTDRKLAVNKHVTGTFQGRVKGYNYDGDSGRLVNIIEVLDAELAD